MEIRLKRAAIVIGIRKYPPFSAFGPLPAAVAAAQAFADWATHMGFEVRPVFDEIPPQPGQRPHKRPVTLSLVKSEVASLVQRKGIDKLDQLVVYFSGHGVNKGFAEHWLLSGAPNDGDEAVNVNASIDAARYLTGIPHIVFISDACRTPAPTVQVQNIEGGSIFPNQEGKFDPAVVDRFYAALPGDPSVEVKVGTGYVALYTDCLLHALHGKDVTVLEPYLEAIPGTEIVTPRRLKSYLKSELPKRAGALGLKRPQDADSLVESVYPAYLSVFQKSLEGSRPPPVTAGVPPAISPPPQGLQSEERVPNSEVHESRPPEDADPLEESLDRLLIWPPDEPVSPRLRSDVELLEEQLSFTKIMHHTNCGFVVWSGGRHQLSKVFTTSGAFFQIMRLEEAQFVWIGEKDLNEPRGENEGSGARDVRNTHLVLLKLKNGHSVLLPALPNFMGIVTFNSDELVNVTYEPATATSEYYRYVLDTDESSNLRPLRSRVAALSRAAAFRVTPQFAAKLTERIRGLNGVDPTLGLYAAYAYHEAGLLDQIGSVAELLLGTLGGKQFFDIALLARRPGESRPFTMETVPPLPLLTQGWSLLESKGIEITKTIREARRHLLPSMWTLFDRKGTKLLRRAMARGELR